MHTITKRILSQSIKIRVVPIIDNASAKSRSHSGLGGSIGELEMMTFWDKFFEAPIEISSCNLDIDDFDI